MPTTAPNSYIFWPFPYRGKDSLASKIFHASQKVYEFTHNPKSKKVISRSPARKLKTVFQTLPTANTLREKRSPCKLFRCYSEKCIARLTSKSRFSGPGLRQWARRPWLDESQHAEGQQAVAGRQGVAQNSGSCFGLSGLRHASVRAVGSLCQICWMTPNRSRAPGTLVWGGKRAFPPPPPCVGARAELGLLLRAVRFAARFGPRCRVGLPDVLDEINSSIIFWFAIMIDSSPKDQSK